MAKQATTPTQRRTTQKRVSDNGASSTGFDGQLATTEIAAILKTNRTNALEARAAFLRANPHFAACSVAGCEGLVGPNYQRLAPDGRKYGFCPRRQVHARLMPQVFGAR